VDEIIIFHNLTREEIQKIVVIQVQHLASRLADKNISIVLEEAASAFIAQKGYDPVYGARPLKRLIQKQIENPLSMAILEGKVQEGDHISIDMEKDEIVFKHL
jgi:ATP-dependent Clp protease ATP-binding subunit ClpA